MERALRCVPFQFSGTPQKRGLGWTCVLCLPRPSSSGRQELAGRALPAAARLLPSAAPACFHQSGACRVCAACVYSRELASSRDPPWGCRPPRISGSLWLETGGLLQFGRGGRLWGRVCPFPLPTASCLRRGWAGPPPASSSSSSLELLNPFVL